MRIRDLLLENHNQFLQKIHTAVMSADGSAEIEKKARYFNKSLKPFIQKLLEPILEPEMSPVEVQIHLSIHGLHYNRMDFDIVMKNYYAIDCSLFANRLVVNGTEGEYTFYFKDTEMDLKTFFELGIKQNKFWRFR